MSIHSVTKLLRAPRELSQAAVGRCHTDKARVLRVWVITEAGLQHRRAEKIRDQEAVVTRRCADNIVKALRLMTDIRIWGGVIPVTRAAQALYIAVNTESGDRVNEDEKKSGYKDKQRASVLCEPRGCNPGVCFLRLTKHVYSLLLYLAPLSRDLRTRLARRPLRNALYPRLQACQLGT
jgi:hypothetical protein